MRHGELRRESVGLDRLQGARESIDGVVFHGQRAVSSGISDLEAVVLRGLLARLDFQGNAMPLGVELATRSLIDRKRRVDEVAPVLSEPLGAVQGASGLFTAGEREFQCAPRPVILFTQAHQRVDPDRTFGLVVHGPARVEIAVLLHERERFARPVFALRLDHIKVRQQQHRLELRVAPRINRHQSALPRMSGRGKQMQLLVGEPGSLEARRHALGGQRAAAGGQTGVRLDQLLVQLAEALLGGGRLRACGRACDEEQSRGGDR